MTAAEKTGTDLVEQRRSYMIVQSDIALFDTAKFEHIQRVAVAMGSASLLPDHIMKDNAGKYLSDKEIQANCFLIVNRAMAWHMDPIALAQASFVLHGKLGFEGKVIAAVIESAVGSLDYEWEGTPGHDDFKITVTGKRPSDGKVVSIDGNVGAWKTYEKDRSTVKANWKGLASRNQLAYRGGQEWARLYAPSLLLGVYSVDELTDPRFNGMTIDAEVEQPPTPTPAKRGPGRPKREPANRMQQAANEQEEKDDDGAAADDGSAADDAGDGGGAAADDGKSDGGAAAGTQQEEKADELPPAPDKKAAAPAKTTERAKPTPAEPADDGGEAFMKELFERIGPDKPLKDYLTAAHAVLAPIRTINDMKPVWNGLTPLAGITKGQQAFLLELRTFHKTRIEALNADETPPAPDKKQASDPADDATFDYEAFKRGVEKALGDATSADDVNRFFAEMTDAPLAEGLITPDQLDNELMPLAEASLDRLMKM